VRSASTATCSASSSSSRWTIRRHSCPPAGTTTTSGFNTWESKGGSPPPPGTTGLYHVAIRYPDRATLADALRRLVDARVPLQGASDHGVSEAIYLADPDGNGIELYRDRPQEEWPRTADGERIAMVSAPLDLNALLAEAVA
jgi:catechol 2,3-dioxygenase